MQFFDTHCDTVLRALSGDLDFVNGAGTSHMDLPRLLAAGSCVQLFAVFAVRSHLPGKDLRAYAEEAIRTIEGWAAESEGRLKIARTASDLHAACHGGGLHGLLGLEGGDPLEDRADNLEHFFRLGIRNIIPAWDDNAFSGTTFGSKGPLTDEGARLIENAEALHMMVDVSHLSDGAFEQVRAMTRRPFIASHSNCRAVCPHGRNLTDEMIRALAGRGGVMGINLSADFLDADYMARFEAATVEVRAAAAAADPEERERLWQSVQPELEAIALPTMESIARHVQHAIQVGGEECVGLGGDLDGIVTMPAGVTGIESYPAISDLLLASGLSEAQVEKVCWRNMERVFSDVLR